MARGSGACLECRRLQTWYVKGRVYVMPACERCGARLEPPGSREYRVVHLEWLGSQRVLNIRSSAAPRWIAGFRPPHVVALDAYAAANMAQWARELAHEARALYPHLRFEFDTDGAGRPLEVHKEA